MSAPLFLLVVVALASPIQSASAATPTAQQQTPTPIPAKPRMIEDPDDFFSAGLQRYLDETRATETNFADYEVTAFTEKGAPLRLTVRVKEGDEMIPVLAADFFDFLARERMPDKPTKTTTVTKDAAGSRVLPADSPLAKEPSPTSWRSAVEDVSSAVRELRDTGNPLPLVAACTTMEGVTVLLLVLLLFLLRSQQARIDGVVRLLSAQQQQQHQGDISLAEAVGRIQSALGTAASSTPARNNASAATTVFTTPNSFNGTFASFSSSTPFAPDQVDGNSVEIELDRLDNDDDSDSTAARNSQQQQQEKKRSAVGMWLKKRLGLV